MNRFKSYNQSQVYNCKLWLIRESLTMLALAGTIQVWRLCHVEPTVVYVYLSIYLHSISHQQLAVLICVEAKSIYLDRSEYLIWFGFLVFACTDGWSWDWDGDRGSRRVINYRFIVWPKSPTASSFSLTEFTCIHLTCMRNNINAIIYFKGEMLSFSDLHSSWVYVLN